jgi:hypothetical protein
LIAAISVLAIAQTAAAKGGKATNAATFIDIIRITDPAPQGGELMLEISGGGFGSEGVLQVLLDGQDIPHNLLDTQMIEATIPAGKYSEGDHEIVVKTGDENRRTDSATITLGGVMTVSCISWFVSGPADEHVHTEVHVEDLNEDAVIGATVTWTAENEESEVPYQVNTSLTNDNDGHAAGENCENPVSGSGVTDWFCCIGAGKWDGEVPPGRRACSPGEYTARIVEVTAPLFTNMYWDGVEVVTSFTLEDTKFP